MISNMVSLSLHKLRIRTSGGPQKVIKPLSCQECTALLHLFPNAQNKYRKVPQYPQGTITCSLNVLQPLESLLLKRSVQEDDNASVISYLDTLTTMTLSDMPHCTINSRLAERARQSILYDRDDSLGRLESVKQSDQRVNFADRVESVNSIPL